MLRKILLLCLLHFATTTQVFAFSFDCPSLFCQTNHLPFDLQIETSPRKSFFRVATTSHNGTCSERQIYQFQNVSIQHQAGNQFIQLSFNPNAAPIFDPYCNQTDTQTSGAIYSGIPVTKRLDGTIILHGAVSVRALMPEIIPGIWPAIWMLPEDTAFTNLDGGQSGYWPQSGEIDIIEMAGYSAYFYPRSTFLNTIHFGNTAGGDIPRGFFFLYKSINDLVPISSAYHTWTLEWRITVRGNTSSAPLVLTPEDVAAIQLTMYMDGQMMDSIKRNWNSYNQPPPPTPSTFPQVPNCDNYELSTGVPYPLNCGIASFTIPSAYQPLPDNDAVPLNALVNGFNSGWKLIVNLASGGPIFYQDPVGGNGAQQPVTMRVSDVNQFLFEDVVFSPNPMNGGIISWLPLDIPNQPVISYTVSVIGNGVNINQTLGLDATSYTIPAHTLRSNQDYQISVVATTMPAQITGTTSPTATVTVGNIYVHTRP